CLKRRKEGAMEDSKLKKITVKDWLTQNEFLIYIGKGREKLLEMVADGLPYYVVDDKSIIYNKHDFYEYMQKFRGDI
ncbi:MAG: hypothetical protein Q4E50_07000, partial [Tissierellia bacterium]|nr:hypothetical protein [Tissierellia bacterium]